MRLSELSLVRPVLATVISLMLCVFGVLAFRALPLREMPDTAAPVVSVETGYEGASASVVESRITKPLEDQLSGIAGIKAISSDTVDGYSSVTIEFVPERDLDAAASDVRDAVARAAWVLPREADTPVVSKADANDEVILWVTSPSSLPSAWWWMTPSWWWRTFTTICSVASRPCWRPGTAPARWALR